MKLAEGPTTEVEVKIEAAPAEVWRWVCDIELPARFSQEFQGASWLPDTEAPAVGARFVGRNRHPQIGEWETTSHVVRCEEPVVLEWAVADVAKPAATWRFELEPDGDGTLLRQWVRLGPGWSGLTIAIERMPDKEDRIIQRRLDEHRENMLATVTGIKELAERAAD
ncbi:SRPBCC family protein [Amycolatopsis sp. CA-230715]|uniref:SRPBCC family protein n=1 Tax=Amycolatopsis sp. CA-230715 TaxID=2745196 RepID=UPI001C0364EE|nr:SRPBCC family protein [Amycolatopsis sp. CA-230715]QWF77241.1 hypothetical protein HUW46_00631 [Amycolatopsis sp. CA-230715]